MEGVEDHLNLETFIYGGTTASGEPRPMSTLTFDDLSILQLKISMGEIW